MPTVTESDLAAAFRTYLAPPTAGGGPEGAALAPLIPGGIWYGTTPQEKTAPYARLDVSASDPEYNSGSTYLHAFTVTLTLWAQGDGATAVGDLKTQLGQVFDRRRVHDQLTVPNADRVVDVRPMAPAGGDGVGEDAVYEEQEPVMVGRWTMQVTVQATQI